VTAELHPCIQTGHAWLFLLYHDAFDSWDYMPVALPVVFPSIESVPSLISGHFSRRFLNESHSMLFVQLWTGSYIFGILFSVGSICGMYRENEK